MIYIAFLLLIKRVSGEKRTAQRTDEDIFMYIGKRSLRTEYLKSRVPFVNFIYDEAIILGYEEATNGYDTEARI